MVIVLHWLYIFPLVLPPPYSDGGLKIPHFLLTFWHLITALLSKDFSKYYTPLSGLHPNFVGYTSVHMHSYQFSNNYLEKELSQKQYPLGAHGRLALATHHQQWAWSNYPGTFTCNKSAPSLSAPFSLSLPQKLWLPPTQISQCFGHTNTSRQPAIGGATASPSREALASLVLACWRLQQSPPTSPGLQSKHMCPAHLTS